MTSDQKSEPKLVIRTRLYDKKSKYQAGNLIPPSPIAIIPISTLRKKNGPEISKHRIYNEI